MFPTTPLVLATLSAPIVLKIISNFLRKPPRLNRIAQSAERVVVLGASSGIGREIAHVYARRGARVCVVGRRAQQLEEVRRECDALRLEGARGEKLGRDDAGLARQTLAIVADIALPEDMVRLRGRLQSEWEGFDTLIITAGVSALKPMLAVAGVERQGKEFSPPQATLDGVQGAIDTAFAALRGNFTGPFVAALTMIPLLTRSSASPSILLLSSLAAVIPAPTRALYASTKSASLVLYQAIAIEHPEIAFSFVLPSTVEGDFRASAVDGGTVRESNPNTTGLKRTDVAQRCVQAVDWREKTVFIPKFIRWGHLLYWLWPAFVERKAQKKYNFSV